MSCSFRYATSAREAWSQQVSSDDMPGHGGGLEYPGITDMPLVVQD